MKRRGLVRRRRSSIIGHPRRTYQAETRGEGSDSFGDPTESWRGWQRQRQPQAIDEILPMRRTPAFRGVPRAAEADRPAPGAADRSVPASIVPARANEDTTMSRKRTTGPFIPDPSSGRSPDGYATTEVTPPLEPGLSGRYRRRRARDHRPGRLAPATARGIGPTDGKRPRSGRGLGTRVAERIEVGLRRSRLRVRIARREGDIGPAAQQQPPRGRRAEVAAPWPERGVRPGAGRRDRAAGPDSKPSAPRLRRWAWNESSAATC